LQILEPPSTTTYQTEQGHFIKTFLISTKANQAGWQIAKETGHQKVQSFIGKPFVIIPEALSSPRQKGHVFAPTKDALLEEYKKHTHGIIESISSPYFYGDGTDDYYYTANIKLSNSKAASALLEHGEKTFGTFAVSPHIWTFDGSDNTSDWEGISLSLVPKGAYGQEAVVNKYCKGDVVACSNSLAAGLCDKEDSLAASTISSLVTQNENKNILSQVQITQPEVKDVQNAQPVSEQPTIKENNTELIDSLKKQLEQAQNAAKEKEDIVTKLVNKDKTNTLNSIFKSVKDEDIKENLIKKYITADTDLLNGYTEDFVKHVVPSLIEDAKAQAESELKQKLVEENKGKSKAGSLPAEPSKEDSKAASIVPKSVNEIIRFRNLMLEGI
jgi:hypothetical protein